MDFHSIYLFCKNEYYIVNNHPTDLGSLEAII